VLTCNAILAWQQDRDIEWQYIAPDHPMQNGFVESFNGYATSALTNTCSSTLKEVSEIIEA
jgi:putative transposase